MSRTFKLGQKPIKDFEVYHGYDKDCKRWFVEIQIPTHGVGTITEWYNAEKDYKESLEKLFCT